MKAKTLFAGAVLALLGACVGPQIQHGQLSAIDKGISPEEVSIRLRQTPLAVHTGVGGARTFDFHQFKINNGLQTDLYLLAYEKNRLLYWGYVSEFRRLQDADLNAALSSVLPQIIQGR